MKKPIEVNPNPMDEYMTMKEVCKTVNRCYTTIRRWYKREDPKFPKPLECDGMVIGFKRSAVMQWLDDRENRRTGTY